jgi:thioredoxin reductase (NADPH)
VALSCSGYTNLHLCIGPFVERIKRRGAIRGPHAEAVRADRARTRFRTGHQRDRCVGGRRLTHGKNGSPMKPLLFLVDDDPQAVDRLRRDLERRYGTDYELATATSPVDGLSLLKELQGKAAQVALLIADQWMPEMTGIEFLIKAHEFFPEARRLVVIDVGDVTAEAPIVTALTLNQLDFYFGKPWASPEEELYPVTGEALRVWAKKNLPRYEKAKLIAPRTSARAHEIKNVLERNAIASGFYPVDSAEGRALLEEYAPGADRFPVLVLYDGRVLIDPPSDEMAEAMGAPTNPEPTVCDVAIVGAGPAGLAAAVYAASEGLRTTAIEPSVVGGQASMSSMIRNYFGFPWGIGGSDLTERASRQATGFGARFVITRSATGLRAEGVERVVTLSNQTEVRSRTIVIATGVSYRRLNVPGIDSLIGAGVFYGATLSEAHALRGADVYVLGGGNSAAQAAVHLASAGARVTILLRGDSLTKSMSDYLVREVEAHSRIDVRLCTQVVGVTGNQQLDGLVLSNSREHSTTEVPAAALFIFIGAEPRSDWLNSSVACDDRGFILTGRDLFADGTIRWPLERQPYLLETSMPGVFAAGDVRHGSAKRVAAAVGEGSTAILLIRQYLSEP